MPGLMWMRRGYGRDVSCHYTHTTLFHVSISLCYVCLSISFDLDDGVYGMTRLGLDVLQHC